MNMVHFKKTSIILTQVISETVSSQRLKSKFNPRANVYLRLYIYIYIYIYIFVIYAYIYDVYVYKL